MATSALTSARASREPRELTARTESVKPGAPDAWACGASAVDRSKRAKGPPIRTPTANAAKMHEHPAAIGKPGAAVSLPAYLPTSPCYGGLGPWWSKTHSTKALATLLKFHW